MYESQLAAGPDDRTGGFDATLTTGAELRAIYRERSRPAVAKEIDHLDANCTAFIAHSPFVVVSTADAGGRCDASPRGGPPGFVRVLDDRRLAVPDLSGNSRLDSFQNLLLTMWRPGGDTPRITGDDPAHGG
jgi:predicted pyridoxine 5'-phosphate oxidase superfamily flavin-nucleotide-binding protein